MNPITFNSRFERAIATHPHSKFLAAILGKWQTAPLFDYETNYDKEIALTPRGVGFDDLIDHPWPFETFRLEMTERDVPDSTTLTTEREDYKTQLVAHRSDGRLNLLIFWRDSPADIMTHIYTITDSATRGEGRAELYSIKRGWMHSSIAPEGIMTIAGSAIGSFGAFIEDAMLPSHHLCEVRPNAPGRSVEWTKARTHFTFITHGHPANTSAIAHGARVESDHAAELARSAHNRREHRRTLRHVRFTYSRGKTITVRATWVGPREWQDAGGRQIYRILEPV